MAPSRFLPQSFALAVLLACSAGPDAGSATDAGTHAAPPDSARGGPPGLGGACIPPDEDQRDWPGASLQDVVLATTDNCATGLCLLNHFQGRVTCPFGQNADQIAALPPDDPNRCRLPFQSGTSEAEAVGVAVPPQFSGRPAADAVYCSCRCAAADPTASLCTCDAGFDCVPLVADTGAPGAATYAGSYCVRAGTEYDPAASYGAPCGLGPPDAGQSCGDRNP
jgi:hypothetical protein